MVTHLKDPEGVSEGDNEGGERRIGTVRYFGREGYHQRSGEKDTKGVKWRECGREGAAGEMSRMQ